MTVEELKNDCNYLKFAEIPSKVLIHIMEDNALCGSGNKFIAWLEIHGDDVVYRVWAYKNTKKWGKQYREVMRAVLGEEGLIYRDMYLFCGGGYKVVYESSRGSSSNWYGYSYYAYDESDFGRWYWTSEMGVSVTILNMDLLKKTKFKYNGYSGNGNFLKWMETYVKYPEVEYLGKLGYEPSLKLLKKAAKDKAFCKYLAKVENKNNISAICYAYDHNMSVYDAGLYLCKKQELGRTFKYRKAELIRNHVDPEKAYEYILSQKCEIFSYCDYVEACVGLNLDMTDTKNAFPKDFKRMHDLRTNQWEVKKSKPRNREFKKAAVKYLQFEIQGKKYSIVIPRQIKDLINEGAELHHCVGKMGYDNKMIKGESFIAFVRKNDSLKTPFVTVEYGIEEEKVLQIYGDYDTNPSKEVENFVKKWGKQVKKEMKGVG